MSVIKRLKFHFSDNSEKDKAVRDFLKNIIGYSPRNYHLFKLATVHSSVAKTNVKGLKESNERLEYLGDAILGAVVAEYLFKKYPFKEEGFLTEIRSRIVSRESLNALGKKLGLEHIIEIDRNITSPNMAVYGDTLEALVGAVYLDRGFDATRKFILTKLLEPNFDLRQIVKTNRNFKSKLIEWSQKENKEIVFETIEIKDFPRHKEFKVQVTVDSEAIATGFGSSKKKAEQDAARHAYDKINPEQDGEA